ncbi:hypothetical protein BgiBS90_034077 [Biomphalaria glabrata]|nr:hypothetical protein BgiBS90_034077 [Biomphalaria glabrata]
MTNRFLFLCLMSYLDNVTGNPQNRTKSSLLFQDKPDLDPVGCNEQTMSTEVSGSKLSCALSCMFSEACVLFSYVSDSKTCSLCHGGMIQNLTFNADKTFSWSYVLFENYEPTTINTTCNLGRVVPGGLSIGTIIHLCIYLFPNRQPYFVLALREGTLTESYPLTLMVSNNTICLYSGRALTNATYIQLALGSLVEGQTHTVDMLVTADGFQLYIDEIYYSLYRHRIPYNKTKFLFIHGLIQVTELAV